MYQLNFDSGKHKPLSFRSVEQPQKKTYKRDYSKLSNTRTKLDRILEQKALERELREFDFE